MEEAERTEAIADLETLRVTGATAVRAGDLSTNIDQAAVSSALRSLRNLDTTERKRRPVCQQIKLT